MSLRLLFAAFSLSSAVSTQAQVCSGIVHKEMSIDGRNHEWTSAEVKVAHHDLVVVFARGTVRVGAWKGAVGPRGNPAGLGRLDMKVGAGTVVPAGERWVGAFDEGGTVKFKVHDTNYSDNSGSYDVHLIIIPASAFPQAVKVETEK